MMPATRSAPYLRVTYSITLLESDADWRKPQGGAK
jgi:hypothetical protein